MISPDWQAHASCVGSDPEMWSYPEKGHGGRLTPAETVLLLKAQVICNGCPVKAECISTAMPEDRAYTMRGGHWPAAITQPAIQLSKGMCTRGHDKSVTGVRTGKHYCAQCYTIRAARRYAEGKLLPGGALTGPLSDAQLATGQCDKGHSIDPPGSLTASLRCVACAEEWKEMKTKQSREWRARKRARMLDSVAQQGEGSPE